MFGHILNRQVERKSLQRGFTVHIGVRFLTAYIAGVRGCEGR